MSCYTISVGVEGVTIAMGSSRDASSHKNERVGACATGQGRLGRPQHNWKPLPVSDMPERLLIDFATRCNLRCHMCPVWGLEDEKRSTTSRAS